MERMAERLEDSHKAFRENRIYDYRELALAQLERLRGFRKRFTRFPCVIPSWDNTARWKATGAMILYHSTPEVYRRWLSEVIRWTAENLEPEKRFIFLNAWNEWGEGTHLEPDLKHGRAYLEATREALAENGFQVPESGPTGEAEASPASPEARYERLLQKYDALQAQLARYGDEEEYSPLLLRSEARYAQLLKRNERLMEELRQARRRNEDLRLHLERFADSRRSGGTLASLRSRSRSGTANARRGTGLLASLKQRNERLATPLIRAVESVRLGGPRVVVERLRRLFR